MWCFCFPTGLAGATKLTMFKSWLLVHLAEYTYLIQFDQTSGMNYIVHACRVPSVKHVNIKST